MPHSEMNPENTEERAVVLRQQTGFGIYKIFPQVLYNFVQLDYLEYERYRSQRTIVKH